MPALITASAVLTCFGDGAATFSALLQSSSGLKPLRYYDAVKLRVAAGYHVPEDGEEGMFRASRWLAACVSEALDHSGIDLGEKRVIAIVATGLRELRAVERWALDEADCPPERLHFGAVVRSSAPQIADVITLSNACSAGGHALALAQDIIELGEADAVVVAGTDSMTESMLAMIGRFAETPAAVVRPFDQDHTGALLGEGAAAFVLEPECTGHRSLGRLLSTGLACDAFHETAPDLDGMWAATADVMRRANRQPADVDLIVAHGTGTALNDSAEARLIRSVYAADGPGPLITAIKGAVGHTSGASPLMNLDVALRSLEQGIVPPIVGLCRVFEEGAGLRFVTGRPAAAPLRLVSVNAFGFGGVNSVTLVERP